MKVLYISTLCAKKTYDTMFGRGNSAPDRAAQKYHSVMTAGLAENDEAEVTCITAPPVSRANYPGKYAAPENDTEGKVRFSYVPVINFPVLKNISAYLQIKKACKKEMKKAASENEPVGIVCDLLCAAPCAGALAALKKFNKHAAKQVRSAGIVTDLPAFLNTKQKKLFGRLFEKNLASCSSYVFLTEPMNERLNPDGKPYAVIEGQADLHVPEPACGGAGGTAENKKRICLYAGSLHRQYGIEMLVNAFRSLDSKDAELHIYGTGDFRDTLIKMTENGGNVRYCGILPSDEIVKKEQEAILLINPRPSSGEYTKYSFPSKNMEYMASGTAVLTAALPGMPAEYHDYVYIFEDESEAGLKKKLEELLLKSDNELRSKGLAARRFVLEKKNNKIQAGKVLALLK